MNWKVFQMRSWLVSCRRQLKKVNGSIDVCHNYAAATLIEAGRDEDLFVAMDKLLQAELSSG